MNIRQGDIIIVNLNPVKGHEQKGVRPAVVISGNAFHVSNSAIVCPLTTQLKHYVGNVTIKPTSTNGLDTNSEILVGQIRTVSIERISKKIGVIKKEELKSVFQGFDLLCDRDRN